jgi:hypothetical protein
MQFFFALLKRLRYSTFFFFSLPLLLLGFPLFTLLRSLVFSFFDKTSNIRNFLLKFFSDSLYLTIQVSIFAFLASA